MKNEITTDVGVIVGRFQVPDLHDAHKELIQQVLDKHPRVLIFLGLAPDSCKCTHNNPLDFAARKAMIEEAFPRVEVLYIKDIGNNELWSKELDRQISLTVTTDNKIVLYGGRDSFIFHYKGKHPTQELVPGRFISGKEIRKNVGVTTKRTKEFREGVIWAIENRWPSVLPTVDIAPIDTENDRVLLCRKPNQTKFRFVGGFASPDSENFEADAARELLEETHLVGANFRYLCSARIDDWRFRNECDKIKTTFFVCEYDGGTPEADDDIAEVKWFNLLTLTENDLVEEHKVLFRTLKEKVIDPLGKANAGVYS
jgi:bifunctional NMN adenylyltransferase/nudix hydrolase